MFVKWNKDDRVIIGNKEGHETRIDPATSVSGLSGSIYEIGAESRTGQARVLLDEPVNDIFGTDIEAVWIELDFLEDPN